MWMLCKKSWPLFCMTINNELHEFKKGRKHMLKKLKKLKFVKKLSMLTYLNIIILQMKAVQQEIYVILII